MRRTELLQELRKMLFSEAYTGWSTRGLTQSEAALLLGVSDRTFRRSVGRTRDDGEDGWIDRRLAQASHRRAPVDEVVGLTQQYRTRHVGRNAKHFYAWYGKEGGKRGYTWVKTHLQACSLVPRAKRRGAHRKRRERAAWPGMMIHQDGSTHQWVENHVWDLIATMDDATSEQYALIFVEQEGTASSLDGIRAVIEKRGVFSSFYSDRGSQYWNTSAAGGKVDKQNLTQFGRAIQRLGITMIPAYSPQARGRSERMFRTHQERLPKELALAGITAMDAANRYLRDVYMPAFDLEFTKKPAEEGSAFAAWVGGDLNDILGEYHERTVGNDNCVSFEGMKLQIPADRDG